MVLAVSNGPGDNEFVKELFPSLGQIDATVPERPRAYLQQARESIYTPAGAIMLAASAVDAKLRAKNYKDGSLVRPNRSCA